MDSDIQPSTLTRLNRPHSIDLSLELERQLDNESLPNSPSPPDRPQSLDATVLASIVTQLRFSLTEVTKERDDLVHLLDEATQNQADLKDNLQLITDRSSQLEEQLSAARDKHKEDEEAISMLRAKVEESRRGLMRLQTESRRMSQLTIDSSRATTSLTSKRMSLISPLPSSPNGGHRRFSSHSDTGFISTDVNEHGQPPPSPFTFVDSAPRVLAREIEVLKKELRNVKDELEETRIELTEATEAREASEQCAKALRDYISDNGVGEAGPTSSALRPPLPATSKSEDPKSSSKWSFKLWNGTSSPNLGQQSAISSVPNRPSLAYTYTAASYESTSPVLTRKFGSLFGGRGGSISSISSTTSQSTSQPPLPHLPSMYRGGSDASSTEEEEPSSPAIEPVAQVMVRDNSSSSGLATGFGTTLVDHGKERDSQEMLYPSTPTATSGLATAF